MTSAAPAAAAEEASFFVPDGFRLLAIAHRPAGRQAPLAVVMCHPYGEEKQLSYASLVRFARLLARDGYPVLRFDQRGHGDSEGNLEDATLTGLVNEALGAGRLAREQFAVSRVAFLGLRLGAAIAARAAERDPGTAGLVLWSPVVRGAQYFDDMIRKRLFADMLVKRRSSRAQVLEDLARDGRLEIEGNFLGRRMTEELGSLDLVAEAPRFTGPVLMTRLLSETAAHPTLEALARSYGSGGAACTFESAGAQPFWERSAMYDGFVPTDLFELTQRWVRDRT